MKARMQALADQNPGFLEYHEGLLGGVNARGVEMSATEYEGWYYNHPSPWMKITADVGAGSTTTSTGTTGTTPTGPTSCSSGTTMPGSGCVRGADVLP